MNNAEEFYNIIKQSMEVSPEMYMKSYSGLSTFFRTKYRPDWETGDPLDIALVGVPSDLGLTQRTGARHGPREIRNQSSNVLYFNMSMKMSPLENWPLRISETLLSLAPLTFKMLQMKVWHFFSGSLTAESLRLLPVGITPLLIRS